MKLASLKAGRDGQLIVVDNAMQTYVLATAVAPTLQAALDNWSTCEAQLPDYSHSSQSKVCFRHSIKEHYKVHCRLR